MLILGYVRLVRVKEFFTWLDFVSHKVRDLQGLKIGKYVVKSNMSERKLVKKDVIGHIL